MADITDIRTIYHWIAIDVDAQVLVQHSLGLVGAIHDRISHTGTCSPVVTGGICRRSLEHRRSQGQQAEQA